MHTVMQKMRTFHFRHIKDDPHVAVDSQRFVPVHRRAEHFA